MALMTTRGKKTTVALPQLEQPAPRTRLINDEARLQRILDPKARTIGIDRDALDAQVREREERLAMEAQAEEWEDKKRVQQDLHAQHLEHEAAKIRAREARDVEDYRTRFQRKELRREWDLNDPRALKGGLPVRVSENDPRATVSSMQRFEGEEPGFAARRYAQRMQMRDWVSNQIDEKNVQKLKDLQSEDQENAYFEAVQNKQWDLSMLHAKQRRQNNVTTADFNRRLAEQKKQEATARKQRETAQNLEEIRNMLDSDMLSERRPGHDKSKGMIADDIAAIRNQQTQQLNDRRAQRIKDMEMDAVMRARIEQDNNMARMMEQQVAQEKRAARVKMVGDNMNMARQKAALRAENQRLYAPEVGEQFYRPFGVTAR